MAGIRACFVRSTVGVGGGRSSWSLIWLREVNEERAVACGFIGFSSPVSAGVIEQVQEPRACCSFSMVHMLISAR
jgi:hypothetical protein